MIIPFNMAAILPNPCALKSHSNRRFLCYEDGGILKFTGEEPQQFFATENAQIPGYVHIKCENGKYLARLPGQTGPPLKIVATADTPNDDPNYEGCTLFEAQNVGPNTPTQVVFVFRHVQSKLYLRPIFVQGFDGALCAFDAKADANNVADVLTAVARG